MAVALVAKDVRHRYGNVAALDGVSLDVASGWLVAIVGQSGSGKTTLLRCFNRMVHPAEGVVLVGGQDVRGQDVIALRRRLGYVQQHGGLLPHWTVSANVGLVLRAMGAEQSPAVGDALGLVGLDAAVFGERYPHELSGGQRQRVALARALAARPDALLLDEPFGALDAISRAEVQTAFADVQRELGLTMILVTHDLSEAARMSRDIVVMRNGRIEQRGSVAELSDSPATDYVRLLITTAMTQLESLAMKESAE
ncbi:MAG: ATP-binding cassette domain-containing protein [Gemmatimonadales bacterium]